MAYDVARFNELTKRMSAYAHYVEEGHLQRAEARAGRRQRARQLAGQINQRLHFRFRTADSSPGARLRTASELLDSDYPAQQAGGRTLYATAMRRERLADRDRRLLAGQHPGVSDQRYISACRHAERWGTADAARTTGGLARWRLPHPLGLL